MNKLFLSIKNHCKSQKTLVGVGIFKAITIEANIPFTSLLLYLDHLQKLGLIKFSMNQYIYLTPLGEQQAELTREFLSYAS